MDTGEYGPNKEIAVVNLKKALKEHYREVKEPYKIHALAQRTSSSAVVAGREKQLGHNEDMRSSCMETNTHHHFVLAGSIYHI